jgi:hypothetical protein
MWSQKTLFFGGKKGNLLEKAVIKSNFQRVLEFLLKRNFVLVISNFSPNYQFNLFLFPKTNFLGPGTKEFFGNKMKSQNKKEKTQKKVYKI